MSQQFADDQRIIIIDHIDDRPRSQPSWRFITAMLGFYTMFNSFTMRSHLSVTIVAMVKTDSSDNQSSSCFTTGNSSVVLDEKEGPFDWDSQLQGIILGAFFWGYMIPQVWAGRMAEMHGPRIIIFVGGLIATISTAIGPWAATVNVWFFFATRVACGLGSSVYAPNLHNLISRWTPPNERSRMTALVYSGNQVGIIAAMLISGFLCQYAPNNGWPWPFYVFAIISGVWLILWYFLVADFPAENKWISDYEKEMISSKLSASVYCNKGCKAPYAQILKSAPVWALIMAYVGNGWAYNTLMTQIPTYMGTILQFNIHQNGLLSALPYVLFIIISWISAILADYLIKYNKLNITHVRKLLEFIACVGAAIFLFIIPFINCQIMAIYTMLVLSVGMGGVAYGAAQVNHIDLSPNFAGTLMGFANSIGCIPGIISPYVTGIIISDSNNEDGWSIVFFISFAVLVATAIQYAIFASGEIQPWNYSNETENNTTSVKHSNSTEN